MPGNFINNSDTHHAYKGPHWHYANWLKFGKHSFVKVFHCSYIAMKVFTINIVCSHCKHYHSMDIFVLSSQTSMFQLFSFPNLIYVKNSSQALQDYGYLQSLL